jgi:hypothetical protein
MKISERTIKRLGEIITGDKALSPYRSGPKLVSFFNDFGTNHTYGEGFPSRWKFAEDCLLTFVAGTAADYMSKRDRQREKEIIVSPEDRESSGVY